MEKLTSLLFPQDDEQQEETQEVRLNLPWQFSVMEKLTSPLFPEKNLGQKVLIMSGILLQGKLTHWEREISIPGKSGQLAFSRQKKTHLFHVYWSSCMQ